MMEWLVANAEWLRPTTTLVLLCLYVGGILCWAAVRGRRAERERAESDHRQSAAIFRGAYARYGSMDGLRAPIEVICRECVTGYRPHTLMPEYGPCARCSSTGRTPIPFSEVW